MSPRTAASSFRTSSLGTTTIGWLGLLRPFPRLHRAQALQVGSSSERKALYLFAVEQLAHVRVACLLTALFLAMDP